MKLDEYFKDWLLSNMMSQEIAAQYMGTGQAQISKICNGGKISFNTIKKLAEFMKMDEKEIALMAIEAEMI